METAETLGDISDLDLERCVVSVAGQTNQLIPTDESEHHNVSENENNKETDLVKSETEDSLSCLTTGGEDTVKLLKIELNVEFSSFIDLRDALERYQQENHVQLIVKDSKLLNAESTCRIIPKVYHLVNQSLMYHSITYCCKCHGELKQKPGTRIKNVGAKRLNCPMYLRFKLTTDFQRLVLYDLHDVHNHGIDPNTFQLTPRQQVYRLSRMKRGQPEEAPSVATSKPISLKADVNSLIAAAIKDVNSVSSLSEVIYKPPSKLLRLGVDQENAGWSKRNRSRHDGRKDADSSEDDNEEDDHFLGGKECLDNPHSPLDPDSSCSDSDEEEFRAQQRLLPFPVRLIGSAIQSSPELMEAAKELIEIQKGNLILEKRKLLLQTKNLELENAKLALEVKVMEKNLASEMVTSQTQDTTIYLQA